MRLATVADNQAPPIDDRDRRIIAATQKGLPLTPMPYHDIAEQTGLTPEEVIRRVKQMQEQGIIRRIAAVPNHYALGYRANGMSVWDIVDERIQEAGRQIGALDYVSHCYHRPRSLPEWPYNLFAMVHGRDREETGEKVKQMAEMLGEACRAGTVLYSTRILKKTGLRINVTERKE